MAVWVDSNRAYVLARLSEYALVVSKDNLINIHQMLFSSKGNYKSSITPPPTQTQTT